MRNLIVLLFFVFTASSLWAVPVSRNFRDMKLPTQQMIEKQTITNPAAAAADDILSTDAGNISTAAVVQTTFDAQPDVPRNVSMTPVGTTADVAACTVTITGTDIFNAVISEELVFAENASTATTGAKAFKTIASVSYPADCEDTPFGATWNVGYGEKIGLKRCMTYAGHLVFSTVSGVYETTRGTAVASATAISGNTIDFNGTMDGAADFEVFFLQNFRCFP